MLFQILLFLILIYFLKYWYNARKWDHLPGFSTYSSLPIMGHSYKLLGGRPIETIEGWCRKFGPIFRADFGGVGTLILSDYDMLCEVLKSDIFMGKRCFQPWWDVQGRDDHGNVCGLISSWGPAWREQRKFMQSQMGDLGVRKADKLNSILMQEADKMSSYLEKVSLESSVVDFSKFFLPVTNNVIWRFLTGKTTSIDDPEITSVTNAVSELFDTITPANIRNTIQAYSVLIYRISPLLGIKTLPECCKNIIKLIKDEIAMHRADPKGNYISRNLAEIEAKSDDLQHVYHGQRGFAHMKATILDIFIAGTDTTATLLEWALLYLADNQICQQKFYEEIKEYESITLEDKINTPYVVAFIEEVLRIGPMGSSLSLPRVTLEDTQLGGYFIPKGTHVFPYLKMTHRNEKYFANANKFMPERFLDQSTGEYKANKHLITFSLGKRRCAGEQLARAEAYLFLTAMVKKFEFKPVNGIINFDYNVGLAPSPKGAKLQVLPRH